MKKYYAEQKPKRFKSLFSEGSTYQFPDMYNWLIAEIALQVDKMSPVDGDTVLYHTEQEFEKLVEQYPARRKENGYEEYAQPVFTHYIRTLLPLNVCAALNDHIFNKVCNGPEKH